MSGALLEMSGLEEACLPAMVVMASVLQSSVFEEFGGEDCRSQKQNV